MSNGSERTVRSRRQVAAGLAVSLATGAGLGPAVASAAQNATPEAGPVPPDFAVVLHVSDGTHWVYALSNVENLQQEWPQARLRVVVDGLGVYALQGDSDVVRRLEKATAAGLSLQVCPNALREHRIPQEAMPSFADMSLGGIVALVASVREGYTYVKP